MHTSALPFHEHCTLALQAPFVENGVQSNTVVVLVLELVDVLVVVLLVVVVVEVISEHVTGHTIATVGCVQADQSADSQPTPYCFVRMAV
jgi:hypothetical protein